MNDLTPKSEINLRIYNLRRSLSANKTNAVIIVQNADLFYFTGTIQRSCLYISEDKDPILFVIKSYTRAVRESSINNIIKIKSFKQIGEVLKDRNIRIPKILGMELDVLPVNLFVLFKKQFSSSCIIDFSNQIKQLRAIKSRYEINIIMESVQKSDELAVFAKKNLKSGISESEMAGIIECEARKIGHNHILRMRTWGNEVCYGNLMSGSMAAVPSYLQSPNGGLGVHPSVGHGPSLNIIRYQTPIIFDYSFVYKGYISDHTRTFYLGEKIPEWILEAHKILIELEEKIRNMFVPGTIASTIYDFSINFIRKHGLENNFMGIGSDRVKFIGHGVGLEVDEYPTIGRKQTNNIVSGMTLAIEPKLVFPNKGMIGIENTYLTTKKGLKNLSSFPLEICLIM